MPAKAYSLTHLSHIEITGPNPRKFLQGQLTCDIEQINSKQSRLAAHCNPQGRMQSLGRIYELDQKLYYCTLHSIAETSMQSLKPYAQFSKTNFNLSSLKSIGLMATLDEINQTYSLPKQEDGCSKQEGLLSIKLKGKPDRYMLIGQEADLQAFCTSSNLDIEADPSEWLATEIRAGQAFLTPETLGKFLPHDICLPQNDGVSFNKGCYIGQEIIARMHYLGKIKKQLWLIEIQGNVMPRAGQILIDENNMPQAELVCFARSHQKILALAVFSRQPESRSYQLENQTGSVSLLQNFSS